MSRRHALLIAVLGAAAVSCGSSSPGGSANAGSRADQGGASITATGSPDAPGAGGGGAAIPGSGAQSPATAQPGAVGQHAATTPAGGHAPVAVASAPAAPAAAGGPAPAGWRLTVYYTAVESFHTGTPVAVTGCDLNADECSNGTTQLGNYPADFVARVKDEGTGRITQKGSYRGRYLAWDAQGGFSIDTSASDANGNPLRPFVSAAADEGVPLGTHLRVLDCGLDSTTGRPPAAADCGRLSGPDWVVDDRSGKAAGSREIDLYAGEEDRPNFENTVSYVIATVNARTSLP
ncbi:MAG TPA: hypothetical protein VGL20_21210 [Candidatus Dormibacteraeota bacterium]